mmetsp:Transcript_13902/g.23040  ORF Transcript_13902/g.23040 Transcript_13902/m.23040 type:complete len:212 (-) Transcript_13902:331-966(-)
MPTDVDNSNTGKRRTMVKDRVGCVRTTTRNLPRGHFTYGMKYAPDAEGAGDVISNWITADPSASKASVRSHVHSNILSIKHGCVTAKGARRFAEQHQHIKMKEILTGDDDVGPGFEGPFGQKTTFAEETVEQLVQAKYTNFSNDDTDYPNVVGLSGKSTRIAPRPTRASEMQSSSRKELESKEGNKKNEFIMKKFQNVPGKLNLNNPAKNA